MNPNVGKTDRIGRIVIGVAIIAIGAWFKSWLGLVGLILLATAMINFCPIYRIFGISTCRIKHHQG